MSKIKFKNTNVDIGNISKNEVRKIVWEFDGDPSEIVHLAPGCGCTAKCNVNGNTVVAEFTNGENGTFEKSIRVFLKDDKPLWQEQGMNKSLNNEKTNLRITFRGTSI